MTDQPYRKVTALPIRWNDDIDIDLDCRSEVEQLKSLFKDGYGYESSVLELNFDTPPQEQISKALTHIARECDRLENRHLLIVYYSGHGKATQGSGLESLAPLEFDTPRTRISWPAVEQNLSSTTSDILLILDCCCAAAVIEQDFESSSSQLYEVLAASSRRQVAEKPGPRSLTKHLIDVLSENHSEPNSILLNSFDLSEIITSRRLQLMPAKSRLLRRSGSKRAQGHIPCHSELAVTMAWRGLICRMRCMYQSSVDEG